MEGIIKFELNHKFVKINCLERENGNLCPFLECEGKTFKCINYTLAGVALHRKIRQKINYNHLVRQGCDYIVQKFLKKKNNLTDKKVVYTDGSNTECEKVFFDLKNNRGKNKFTVLIKAQKEILPFPMPIDGEYLSITEFKDEKIIRISNHMGMGNSIDILI